MWHCHLPICGRIIWSNVREFTVTVRSVNTFRWNTWKHFLIPRIAIRGKISWDQNNPHMWSYFLNTNRVFPNVETFSDPRAHIRGNFSCRSRFRPGMARDDEMRRGSQSKLRSVNVQYGLICGRIFWSAGKISAHLRHSGLEIFSSISGVISCKKRADPAC